MDAAQKLADKDYHDVQLADVSWSWKFRLLEAETLLWRSRFPEVVGLLSDSPPTGIGPEVTARRRILQARALCRLGKANETQAAFKDAERLISQSERGLQSELAFARGKCAALSDPGLAQSYYGRSASLSHGVDPFMEARGLLDGGSLLLRDGRYDEAIQQFNEVLKLTDAELLQEPTLGNIGFGYAQLGDWKRAIPFFQQAESLAAKMPNLQEEGRAFLDLGKAHHALWELGDAEANYLKALSIAQSLGDTPAAAACYNNLTRVALSKHDAATAQRYMKDGEALDAPGERLHFAFDEAMVAATEERWREAGKRFSALADDPATDPVLRSMTERELGEVYWHQNRLSLADRMFRSGIETAETTLMNVNNIEHRMSFLDEERFYDSYIRFLVAQNRAVDALTVTERARAQVWAQERQQRFSWPTSALPSIFQAQLRGTNQTVLAYWITNEESFLWVITSSKFHVFRLPGHLDLHRAIEQYNAEIQDHRDITASPAAKELYITLVQPAEKFIVHGAHVILVPSKVLSWVSFGALIATSPNPHYWVEDVDLQIVGSLDQIPRFLSRPVTAASHPLRDLLIIGAPTEVSSDFPALKHASEEVRLVQSHFASDQERTISGKNATPRAYATADPGDYRYIHLDTHGTASDRSPLDSAIILSSDGDNSYKLYAREIKDIPLHADLVTISACYGAGTRWYNNEGVVGLGWAFLRAGARQVIAGLWEVDDASSPQLMDDFYGELTQGKPASEALRDAKLKMLHSSDFHRHPYYWASLQLYSGS